MLHMINTFHWNLNNQSALCLDLLQFHLQLALLIIIVPTKYGPVNVAFSHVTQSKWLMQFRVPFVLGLTVTTECILHAQVLANINSLSLSTIGYYYVAACSLTSMIQLIDMQVHLRVFPRYLCLSSKTITGMQECRNAWLINSAGMILEQAFF